MSRYERRWSAWIPWATVGAGAALGLVGLALKVAAESTIDDFDDEIARACPAGCSEASLPEAVRGLESRAGTEDALAMTSFVAGGAGIAAGIVLLILNQPQRVEFNSEGQRVSLSPRLAPGSYGFSLGVGF